MATPFLLSVDPKEAASGELTLQQISYFGRVLIKASTATQASDFLRENFRLLDVYVDVTGIEPVGDVVDILNAGAAVAFVSLAQLKALSQEENLPSSRLVVSVSSEDEVNGLKSWISKDAEREYVGVHTASLEADAVIEGLAFHTSLHGVYRSFDKDCVTLEALEKNREQGAISVVSSTAVTVEKNTDGKISAAQLLTSGAVSEKGTGLYATSVTDERGISLGLVWSSDESVSEALRTGTGVYQSRKRGLWYKGQSSGDTQELVRIGFDCDSDCFVFVVRQKGKGLFFTNVIQVFYDILTLQRLLSPGYRQLLWSIYRLISTAEYSKSSKRGCAIRFLYCQAF